MDEPIRAFIGFLRTEQRASPETLRNYASDLRQLHKFLLSRRLVSSPIDPEFALLGRRPGISPVA